jgi:inner membrane protein
VDNITHSLVGIALAELVQPRSATVRQRRVLMAASVVAANLPDIDLAYTWITPPPLGYLLHHRGHTHTLAGLVVLGLLLAVWFRLWPAARELTAEARTRLWGLVAISLAGHVSLDALNTYGVHPFYPFDVRWYYGDAVFIFEPLIWLILGIAAVCNARRRGTGVLLGGFVSVLLLVMAAGRVVPVSAIAVIAAIGALFLAAVRYRTPRTRAGAALAITAVFIAGMMGLSRLARTEARAAMTSTGEIVDVIVAPDPGMPVCWSVIVLSRTGNGEDYRADRGTLSLVPSWYRPDRCASYRLAREDAPPARFVVGHVVWRDTVQSSVAAMRDLSQRDCWVRGWLQFGRAPVVRGNLIMDLRFDTSLRANFTAMPLGQEGCPLRITGWGVPRADLFGP